MRHRHHPRIGVGHAAAVEHLLDRQADAALHRPLLHRLHLAGDVDLHVRLLHGSHPQHLRLFLGQVRVLARVLAHRQVDQVQHLGGVRLIGDRQRHRRHRVALVVVDDPGDAAVGDDDLVALGRAQIGHPHGGGLHRPLHVVDLDVIPDRKLVFKNHEHSRDDVLDQALRAKADGKAADACGDEQVAQRLAHPQDAQHNQKGDEVDDVPRHTSQQGHQGARPLGRGSLALIFGRL